ncbi:unnamed protein product [Diabrotica balteata]|uniref:Uncharacterized protein n=1 Tax=Diabrotica balteata TaxID=107213 RepID=A0A9N9SQB4_DIABA|nr:unnamed protein product [Diabrotica balteata]
MKIKSIRLLFLCMFCVACEVEAENAVNFAVNFVNKTLLESKCKLHLLRMKLYPHTHFSGTNPCDELHGQAGELPKGFDPHVEIASMKPPDILTNGNVPVNKVTVGPNNAEKNKIGEAFPNNLNLNNGQAPNTNGAGNNIGSGIPNTQNPNGQVQPFNPYINGWNYPNNGFNPNTGYPNYQFNPAGQYPYPGPFNPNPNQFYPNGQPIWGSNGNLPNQGGYVGTNTWGNNQGTKPGTFPNTNQPNTGQNFNWPYNPNQYPGQTNNGQYPNVNGVPNWMPNQNTNQNSGQNQGQFPNPWGLNPNSNQDQKGQNSNQGTNTNSITNQGSGQTSQLPNNNPKQGSVQYPNQNGQPIWGNQSPNQGTGQNGQSPNINNQPVWGNVSPNENNPKNTGIVFPGPDSQGPGGRTILNSKNGTYIAPTLLSSTSTTTVSSSTTITTPMPRVTSSSKEIKPEITQSGQNMLITITSTTSTTSKPNCRHLSHSSKRRKNNDDYEDDDSKEKENSLPICDESTDRPETTVTVKDGKSLIGGVKSNCQEGFVADLGGNCRELY